jgi:small subunit ribosomal protein S16
MLVIRLQRTGRKGHAMFRVVVQDSRWTPTSGKVIARLGSYDPHAKTVIMDKEKVKFYLDHGAQPSERLARLIKNEGVDLPSWVKQAATRGSTTRNPDKRRSTRPEEPKAEEAVEETAPAEESVVEEQVTEPETPVETAEPAQKEEPVADAPASEPPKDDIEEVESDSPVEEESEPSETPADKQ